MCKMYLDFEPTNLLKINFKARRTFETAYNLKTVAARLTKSHEMIKWRSLYSYDLRAYLTCKLSDSCPLKLQWGGTRLINRSQGVSIDYRNIFNEQTSKYLSVLKIIFIRIFMALRPRGVLWISLLK